MTGIGGSEVTISQPCVHDAGIARPRRAFSLGSARAAPPLNFPAPRFPAGVAAPSLFLLVVLFVVAGICIIEVQPPGMRTVPPSVLSSQLGLVERSGMALAVSLAVVAVLVFIVFRRALVRPICRLRDDIHALAAGEKDRVVHRCRVREVDTVAAALQRWSTPPGTKTEEHGPQRRWRVSLNVVSATMCVLVLGWVAAGSLTVMRPDTAVQADIRLDENRQLVAAAAALVGHQLEDGLSQVRLAVTPPLGDVRGYDLAPRMRELVANERVFRSAYVVDRPGAVIAQAGRAPLRMGQQIPAAASGITQLNTTGRAPVIVAFAWTSDGAKALVAEFNVSSLRALLQTPGAHLRIVDSGLRIILDGQGYRAFATLTDPSLRDSAAAALHDVATVQMSPVNNDTSALAALPIGDRGPAAGLRWVILGDQQVGVAAFQDNPVARTVLVAVGLAAAAGVIVLVWTWLVVIRPLRRVADVAVALSASNTSDTAATGAERFDEIGAIVTGLNRCRAQFHSQPASSSEVIGVSIDQLSRVGS